ncbi:MAG: AI-2E family transporter [Patescibacteria group bacterium]|jgi:predicted PurR-regulated permease PerM|nr:AI-2E family transporter [Patescibacteria group bacterium]
MQVRRNKNTAPEWIPRIIALVIAAVISTLLVLFVIYQIRDLIAWLAIALFLSFALEPLVNYLVHKGWNRNLATVVVIFSFLMIIIGFIASMLPLIVQQSVELIKQSPSWLTSAVDSFNRIFGTSVTQADILGNVTAADRQIGDYINSAAVNLLGFSRQLLYSFVQVFAVLLFTFYFVKDGPALRRLICSFLRPIQQRFLLNTWELAIEKTGGYIFSRLILVVISFFVHYIFFIIIGLPFALPLALWMGLVSQFVPIIGTYIAAALPVLVALLVNPFLALLVLLFIIVYQQVENYFFMPKISAQTMELHPAVAFGAVMAGISLGGAIGAILALPVAGVLQEITKGYLRQNKVIESKLTKKSLTPTKNH